MSDLNYLPHDPVGFFELPDSYDRRDLKRAYGKAIRQYKPETHPQEFQLIREAYERLEKQLRYGQQQQQRAEAVDAWAPPAAEEFATESAAQAERQPAQRQLSVRELALVDPAAAMSKLQEQSRRTAQDYYLAAILVDAAGGKMTAKYLGELLDGLMVYPHDPGLIALATEYLKTEVPDSMAGKIVQFVAKKLRSPLFYMLTESLWVRMVNTMPFDEFESLLSGCERLITQSQPGTRRTFFLRLLRSGIWVASPEWTNRILYEIESHSAGMDQGTEYELEFLTEIQKLMQSGESRSGPVRSQLFAAMRLICQHDEPASLAKVNQILSDLGRDSTAIQTAFPVNESLEDNDDEIWISLVHKLVYQLQAYAWETEEIPPERIMSQTVQLLQDLQPTAVKVLSGVDRARSRFKQMPLISWMVVGSIVGIFPVCIPAFLLPEGIGGLVCVIGIVFLIVGLFVSFYRWLFPKFLEGRMERSQHRMLMRDYSTLWRSRLFRFVQSNHETINVHSARIESVAARAGRTDLGNTIQHFLRNDAGLCLFAAIQTVLR